MTQHMKIVLKTILNKTRDTILYIDIIMWFYVAYVSCVYIYYSDYNSQLE